MDDNSYMIEMRSMGGPPGPHQQPPQVSYGLPHHQHQSMNMAYIHTQQTHVQHSLVDPNKYPQNNIIIHQNNLQPAMTHQISYMPHHHLVNLAPQDPYKYELPIVPMVEKPLKKTKTSKPKVKPTTTKIVKCKNPVTPEAPTSTLPTHCTEEKPQKKKGRKRKYAQSREERKENMYKNLPYINSRNQEVKPKVFEDYDCKCPLKCRKRVSAEARRQEFEAFYALGSYTAQNVFLLERIKEIDKKTKIPKAGKKKVKKKSQTTIKRKNFPKMSTKYKGMTFSSSDEDCKDDIVLKEEYGAKAGTATESKESSPEKKTPTNAVCLKGASYKSLKLECNTQAIADTKTRATTNSDSDIIVAGQKHHLYHYQVAEIQEPFEKYSNSVAEQLGSMEVHSTIPNHHSILPGNVSVLQVAGASPNTIQVIATDMNHPMAGDHVEEIIVTDPNQIHSEIKLTQHIIYTSEHIPYSDHQIIYTSQDDCTGDQILYTVPADAYSHQAVVNDVQQFTLETGVVDQGEKCKRKRKAFKAERLFTRIYHLKKIRVCREMFVKTLKISSGRVNTVLKKNRSGDGLYRKSENQGGHNKLTDEQKTAVCNHIHSMMHYMANNPQMPENKMQPKSLFPSGFSLKSIYKIYKSNADISKPVSFTSYSRIFYKEFNPKKPTAAKNIIPDKIAPSNTGNFTGGFRQDTGQISGVPELSYTNSLNNVQPPVYSGENHSEDTPESESQPKKKGRKRMFGDLTRQERKFNMYRNLPYVNSRKQQVLPKQFEDFDCGCPLKCRQRVSPKERKKEFERYYELGSYVAQNMFLLDRVEECVKKRCYIKNRPAKRERNFSRVYKLSKVRVCREMFLKTLKISSVRVNTVLNKKRTGEECTYKRGLNQGGMNKITEEQKNAIIDHINGIISSLSVQQHSNMDGDLVFPLEYTFKKMYEIYLQNNHSSKSVSFSTYRRVFNDKFDFKIIEDC